jgi:hypothetical protein
MDKYGAFWYAIWRLVAISIVTIAAIIGGCQANDARVINEMNGRGTPAIEAACAISGLSESSRAAICAMQGKQR